MLLSSTSFPSSSSSSSLSLSSSSASVSSPPLSSILGSQLLPTASYSSVEGIASFDASERELIDCLCPASIAETPSPSIFREVFEDFISRLGKVRETLSGTLVQRQLLKRKRDNNGTKAEVSSERYRVPLNQPVIQHVGQRALLMLSQTPEIARKYEQDVSSFSSTNANGYLFVFAYILRSNSLSSRFLPGLISTLISMEAISLLECALVHVHDVTEKECVQILQWALHDKQKQLRENTKFASIAAQISEQNVTEAEGKKLRKRKKKKQENITNSKADEIEQLEHVEHETSFFKLKASTGEDSTVADVMPRMDALIDLILSSPRSDTFLKIALHSLPLPLVPVLLLYLHDWLIRYWHVGEANLKQRKQYSQQRIPSLSQVADWLALLLDAHFTNFIVAIQSANNKHDNAGASNNVLLNGVRLGDVEIRLPQLFASIGRLIFECHLPICESMRQLKGFLSHVATIDPKKKLATIHDSNTTQDYVVEVLTL